MYKKIALAVSAALLAGSAFASSVTLYGLIDTGLSYTHTRFNDELGNTETTKSFSMDSGNSAGSRWGLKGIEELGNGLKVGFVLESGFNSDTGTRSDDRLFNRESSLFVSGDFGTVYAGRMTALIGDSGSIGWYGAMASPFGSGWGEITGHEEVFVTPDRLDNTIAYVSPRFSGLQFSAQYSMGDDGAENTSKTNRYAALGLDYQAGNLEVGFLVDYMNKKTAGLDNPDLRKKIDDAFTVNLAANYDFGVLKAFAALQYFKNTDGVGGWSLVDNDEADIVLNHKGLGVNLGVDVPLWGGNFMVSAGYADADADTPDGKKFSDRKVYYGLAGYSYPLSKRTSVYVGGGYHQVEDELALPNCQKLKTRTYQFMTGLVHKF